MNLSPNLYIIGNGFDRYHGIRSDYDDFGKYLSKVDRSTYDKVEEYFCVEDDDFWWEFESRLASFDADFAIDNASSVLMSYGDDEWSDAAHHDYQYELESIVVALSSTMRAHFSDWIRQLDDPKSAGFSGILFNLAPDARYLTFNYTPTLERTYGVPDGQILHIHGNASNPIDKLVLGHGWKPAPDESYNHGIDLSEADTRVIEGNRIVDSYFASTFKPTEKIIAQHKTFFSGLSSVNHIYVMGHSLSDVDAPYLNEIVKNINLPSVRWTVSYFRDSTSAQQRVSDLGIDSAMVTFAQLDDVGEWTVL